MKIDIAYGVTPTTFGKGPFHPAVATSTGLWYWPNITYPTEEAAFKRALEIVDGAFAPAQEIVNGWNVAKAIW